MKSVDAIKKKILTLYRTDPHIHVNVSMSRPKVSVCNCPAVIKAVYAHVFQIEECSEGIPRCHTLQYTDVYTKQVEILEIEE